MNSTDECNHGGRRRLAARLHARTLVVQRNIYVFRVPQDVLPYLLPYVWRKPEKEGTAGFEVEPCVYLSVFCILRIKAKNIHEPFARNADYEDQSQKGDDR